jgi:hypothetical protein
LKESKENLVKKYDLVLLHTPVVMVIVIFDHYDFIIKINCLKMYANISIFNKHKG